jgi:hypothetical protein
MSTSTSEITFVIPGQVDHAASATRGSLKAGVRVGTQRGGAAPLRVTARVGDDVVVLGIVNGPTLVLNPEDARDLMRAQQSGATRGGPGSGAGDDVLVSAQLAWPGIESGATRGATRGWLGQAVLGSFHVVTGLLKDPAVTLATAAVTYKVDGQVEPGVYGLSADALPASLKGSGRLLTSVPAATDGGATLVLVHGTFVDTVSTFGKLWAQHPQTVRDLFAQYAGRVYALDHPTMGASPIANALTLVQTLPSGATLHLVTHSRGGLVAEVLARACSGAPLGADELKVFAGDGYSQHRGDLQQLYQLSSAKRVTVARVVRVACPARGTLLASKRLDAYLSVLQWGLQLAGVPVAPALVDFLHEVARRRADPAELPGLEAMMPESPVVAWLNSGNQLIPGELRVIAGDMEGDSIGSWVKTLLTDAFYWTDNDIVVQTRSMYGGAPRAVSASGGGASFVLDRGAKVTHFNYFSNDRTVTAMRTALLSDAPAGFSAIGPLSWAGEDASGTRGLTRSPPKPQPDKPAVFVLPGILGSNLAVDGTRVWLGVHFLNGLKTLAWDPATAAHVTPDGPIGWSYDALIAHLGETHEVIPFAYDWRRPVEDEARRLADAVDAALTLRAQSGEPVRLLAHSMGGLVARTMRLERPETWARMMAVDGARLLMLGTPNGGSWAPMQTLSGDDTFGNALVAFGSIFDNSGARKMTARMPGFIQLQAGLLDPAQGLAQATTWQKLADDDLAALRARSVWHDEDAQRTIYEWGAPPQTVLDQAVELRKRLDAQVPALGADAAKMLLVVGHADQTPVGIVQGNDGLEYLEATDGDGRVPLSSALLPGVRTWRLDAEHGKLPDVASAFDAYVELLATGRTASLDSLATEAAASAPRSVITLGPAIEAAQAPIRSRPSRGMFASLPPSAAADTMAVRRTAGADRVNTRARASALRVSVLNADLKFVSQPLLVGHYRALALSGAEGIIDVLVAQAMSESLAAGLYPDATGTQQIFNNQRPDPDDALSMARPQAVIVVGLGEEGKLRATELVYSTCQAVLAYAQRFAEQAGGSAAQFELAATLMGSGGTGVSPGGAAQLIAQGAYQANEKLQAAGWPQLAKLTLVELYLDRASDAWRALQVQAQAAPNQLELVGRVESGEGAIRRSLDPNYRGAAYDFISALPGLQDNGEPTILYTLDTRRARTEVRAVRAQGPLLRELVAKASNSASTDAKIGRTLFKLLVPVEMEPFLGGTSEVLIELEGGTAVIPWELLDTDAPAQSGADSRPWAIRAKLLRKLRTRDFRAQVSDASADDSVLVIGTPLCDPPYPDLPGARAEAVAVAAQLASGAAGTPVNKVRALVSGQDDARAVINALFAGSYRVVHVAGHGMEGANGGVVLSGGTFLGADEVKAMRTVPELVFLNCCHLAGRDAHTTLAPYDRAAFAANIAQALIEVGVRCVIAAGWAVEDGPAEIFATTFYAALLEGQRFIAAVATAREAAWRANPQGNTWAAYQCYGDPGWTWQRAGGVTQRPPPVADSYAGLSSPVELAIALETLATVSRFGRADPARQRDKLRYLESTFGSSWGRMGAVAEAFGVAFAEMKGTANAIAWYRIAVSAPDASASFKAVEQLGNQLARLGEALDDDAAARASIEEGIAHLVKVATLQPTVERESLLGAAYKRLAMVEGRRTSDAARQACLKALKAMATHYAAAEARAREGGAGNLFYPAKNGISAELRIAWLEARTPQGLKARCDEVRRSLASSAAAQPDFWSVVGQSELRVLEALAQGRLAAAGAALIGAFRDLKARVPAARMWDSVCSEARFTLVPYQAVASDAEAKAARQLLASLQELATR